jgi:hypothetical protein
MPMSPHRLNKYLSQPQTRIPSDSMQVIEIISAPRKKKIPFPGKTGLILNENC